MSKTCTPTRSQRPAARHDRRQETDSFHATGHQPGCHTTFSSDEWKQLLARYRNKQTNNKNKERKAGSQPDSQTSDNGYKMQSQPQTVSKTNSRYKERDGRQAPSSASGYKGRAGRQCTVGRAGTVMRSAQTASFLICQSGHD